MVTQNTKLSHNQLITCSKRFVLIILNPISTLRFPYFYNVLQLIKCDMGFNFLTFIKICQGTVNFGSFRNIFIFTKSVKRHICDIKNSHIRYDSSISVNDRVITLFLEDFIFTIMTPPLENFGIYSTYNLRDHFYTLKDKNICTTLCFGCLTISMQLYIMKQQLQEKYHILPY